MSPHTHLLSLTDSSHISASPHHHQHQPPHLEQRVNPLVPCRLITHPHFVIHEVEVGPGATAAVGPKHGVRAQDVKLRGQRAQENLLRVHLGEGGGAGRRKEGQGGELGLGLGGGGAGRGQGKTGRAWGPGLRQGRDAVWQQAHSHSPGQRSPDQQQHLLY